MLKVKTEKPVVLAKIRDIMNGIIRIMTLRYMTKKVDI